MSEVAYIDKVRLRFPTKEEAEAAIGNIAAYSLLVDFTTSSHNPGWTACWPIDATEVGQALHAKLKDSYKQEDIYPGWTPYKKA